MTFVRRRIDVTLTLGPDGATETMKLTGHRVTAEIATITSGMQPQANIQIYGLPQDLMHRMTLVGPTAVAVRGQNKMMIEAGDDGGALSNMFSGTIGDAWADYGAAPDVCLNVTGFAALAAAMKPVQPSSFKGATAAEMVIAGLAKEMGFTFENHGVSAQLSSPYLPGTAYEQMTSCAKAAGINYIVDRGVLAIWPEEGFITDLVPVISPKTGMVGYPTFSSRGVAVTTQFRPDVRAGAQILVDSSIKAASGYWNVFSVVHSIESERPSGPWFTYINAYRGPQ